MRLKICMILTTAALLSACSGPGGDAISAESISGAWPFTVPELRLRCGPSMALFGVVDGKAYPLNGQAERRRDSLGQGLEARPLSEIHRPDPEAGRLYPGAGMSLEPVLRAAIEKCEKSNRWNTAA